MSSLSLSQLNELLFEEPFRIISTLCIVSDDSVIPDPDLNPDELANAIITLFIESDKISVLLSELMKTEINNTIDESTLFRRNCMITKLLTIFANRAGLKYLQRILKPILGKIPNFEIEDYELDKNRNPNLTDEKLEENVQNSIQLCKDCVTVIVNSVPLFPPQLRKVCKELHLQVKDKFPNSEYSCIGGLIFLRFICPAIINPETSGLLPAGALSSKHRRILVLISKILQNISNKIVSNAKEGYMQTMNFFVKDSIPIVMNFFKELATGESDPNITLEFKLSNTQRMEILEKIAQFVKGNIHKIGSALISGTTGPKKVAQQIESEKLGYLLKYGENFVTDAWRKRWFILRGNQLLYFKDITDSHAAGIIPLSDASITYIDKTEFMFEIETPYRCYRLKASSTLELTSWFKAINHVITFNNTKQHSRRLQNGVVTRVNSCSALVKPKNIPNTMHKSPEIKKNQETQSKWVKPTISNSNVPNRNALLRVNDKDSHVKVQRKNTADEILKRDKINLLNRSSSNENVKQIDDKNRGKLRTDKGGRIIDNRGAHRGIPKERGLQRGIRSRGNRGIVRGIPKERGLQRGTRIKRARGVVRGAPSNIHKEPAKETQPENDSSQWNSFSKTNIKRMDSPQRQKILCENSHRSFNPQSSIIDGILKRRNFEKHIWEEFKYVVKQYSLIQFDKDQNRQMEVIYLLGSLLNTAENTGSPNCFEITRGRKKFIFQTANNSECNRWIERLKESITKTDVIRAGIFDICEPSGRKIPAWVELCGENLMIFEILETSNRLMMKIQTPEVIVRTLETGDGFVVNDDTHSVTLITNIKLEIKAWTTEIKCSKLNYWKKKKEQSNTNSPLTPLRKDTGLLRQSSGKLTIPGPSLEEANSLSGFCGFLIKMEKDRKSGTRIWAVALKGNLWCYKIDLSTKPVSQIKLSGTKVKIFDIAADDFQLEIFNPKTSLRDSSSKESSVLFEAADASNLNLWFTTIKNQIIRYSEPGHQPSIPSPHAIENITHSGYFYSVIPHNKRYWFVVDNHILTWYFNEGDKSPVNSVQLQFCTLEQLPDNSIRINSPGADELILKPIDDNSNDWPFILANAKNNYWRSNAMLDPLSVGFTNRGFLLKLEGKRWIRRWIIIIQNYILIYKSPKDPNPLGEIILTPSCNIENIPSKENQLRLEISWDDKFVQLETSGVKNLELWLTLLRKAKNKYREPSYNNYIEEDATQLENALRNPTKEGFLMKQGVTRKSWKRRWFVLSYPSLYYFSSSQISPGEQAGEISLKEAQIVIKVQDGSFTRSVQFQIETRTRIFFLRADTEEDAISWVQSIYQSKAALTSLSGLISPKDPALSTDEFSKSGYLIKKGRTNKVWKKRWFLLSPGLLLYFKAITDTERTGEIVLNQDCSVTIADESIKRKNCFVLATRYRNYFLQANDQFEMAVWIETIKYHCKPESKHNESNTPENIQLFTRLNEILAQHES